MVRPSEATTIGTSYDFPPQPPIEANTTWVEAPPLRFGVEYRDVDLTSLAEELGEGSDELRRIRAVAPADFDEEGVSVHVCDAETGHEHVRFDAFLDFPHYHYNSAGGPNRVVAYDPVANGPVTDWVIGRLRLALPAMLIATGAPELAARVRAADLTTAIDRVADLCWAQHGLSARPHR